MYKVQCQQERNPLSRRQKVNICLCNLKCAELSYDIEKVFLAPSWGLHLVFYL